MTRTLLATLAALLALTAPASAAKTTFTIKGAGFGHGVGMSQYGALGYAQHGASYDDILRHYYSDTSLGSAPSNEIVRVLLQSPRVASFSGASRAGTRHLVATKTYQATSTLSGQVVLRSSTGRRLATFAPPMTVTGSGPIQLQGNAANGVRDGLYRGWLEFRPSTVGGVLAINAIGLEQYVAGVVSAESPSNWPAAALEAQAVAARTYAIPSRAGSISDGFDQYADTRSQMYKGVAAETANTNAAVNATAGQIVTYAGQPVTTYFFSTSGGHTESIENSFVGSAPKPWLKGVDDPYDDLSPKHRWKPITLTTKQVSAKLRGLVRGKFKRIDVLQRGTSPRVVRAQVVGTKGTTPVTGPQLRSRFGLFDTWAYFTTVRSNGSRAPLAPATPPAATAASPDGTGTAATTTQGTTGGAAAGGAATVRAAKVRRAARATGPMISGSIEPAKPGARIRVERRTGSKWVLAVDAGLTSGGRYAVAVPGAGVYRVRYAGGVTGPAVRVK